MTNDSQNNSIQATPQSSSSSKSISNNPTSSIPSNPQFQNITNFIPIKLKEENYLLWKSLFLPVLRSFDLLKYVDGSFSCPSPTIQSIDLDGSQTLHVNQEYLDWIKTDQTLLIWFNATISEEILPYVIGISTSRSLWVTLENRLAALSRSHILQLKARLQTIRKENSSIATYLRQIKTITDGLAAAGNIVEDIDLVFHILNGLPSDYNSFATSIRVREPPITSAVLHSLLLSEELCLENRNSNQSPNLDTNNQAFYTHQTKSPSLNYRGTNRSNYNRGRGRSQMQSHRPLNNNSSQNLPHLQPQNKCFQQYFTTNPTKPNCQICGKPNHSAIDCFHRMDYAYVGKQPPQKLHAMAATSSSHNRSPSSSSSPNWILDSGANTHLTNDISQLENYAPYRGTDQIQTANGDYLPISNIGQHFGDQSFPRET